MVKNNNGKKEKSSSTGEAKLFIQISSALNKRIRSFRHSIESDRFNASVIELLELGLKKADEPGVIEELRKKYIDEVE